MASLSISKIIWRGSTARSPRCRSTPPLSHAELRALHAELIALNKVEEGVVYLEITRGVADRDFPYPEGVPPTVVAFTQSRPLLDNPYAGTGVKVITLPDIRWKRRDIKSTALLAQTMGKQEAKRRGAYEAWMVEDGFVTEGTSSTAFILDVNGTSAPSRSATISFPA